MARALVGSEGTCVTVLEAQVHADRQPAAARRWWCSATPMSTRPPTTCRRSSQSARSACEGIDERADRRHARRKATSQRLDAQLLPEGTAGCWSSSARDTQSETPIDQARALMDDAAAQAAIRRR